MSRPHALVICSISARRSSRLTGRPRVRDIRHSHASPEHIRGALGDVPDVSLEDGLRLVIEHFASAAIEKEVENP